MTRRSLERRLATLESARTPDDSMYVVDIGEPDVDDGERVPLDEWQRRYSRSIVVDIGGELEQHAVNRQGSSGHER